MAVEKGAAWPQAQGEERGRIVRVFQSTYKDRAGVTRKTKRWYCEIRDHRGKPRRLPAFTDRRMSEALGRNCERLVSAKVSGETLDPVLTRWVETLPARLRKVLSRIGLLSACKLAGLEPLLHHLEGMTDADGRVTFLGFRQALVAKGGTARHVDLVVSRGRSVVEGCGFIFWSDISSSKVMSYLDGLRAERVVCNRKVLRRLDGVRKIGPSEWTAFCPVHQNPPGGDAPGLSIKVNDWQAVLSCRGGCDVADVHRALGCMRAGTSAQTFNFYLAAFKQFCRWMVRDGRASESPVAHLDGLNVRADRRHDRRALSVDELRWLLSTTHGEPARHGMAGPERAMLYRVAVETGLRRGELASLTRESFALDGPEPTVTVGAAYSKHRRRDVLPLRSDTAAALRDFLACKMPAAPAFNVPSRHLSATMFRADLTAARAKWLGDAPTPEDRGEREQSDFLAYRDGAGAVADFHSLRHAAGSPLAATRARPKVAQSLMRHSDINLTMSRYSHVLVGQERDAVNALPDLSRSPREAAAATGTDDANVPPERLALCLARKGGFPQTSADSRGQNNRNMARPETAENPRKNVDSGRQSATMTPSGEVPERSNGPVLKTGVPARAPWVRIPPSPPSFWGLP